MNKSPDEQIIVSPLGNRDQFRVHYKTIPLILREYPQWILWKREISWNRYAKIPYQCNGRRASPTNPATWASFEEVLSTLQHSAYSGIGFAFTERNGLIGIDYDHCRDPNTGIINPVVNNEVWSLGSYGEISPSGTGLHVICEGIIPGLRRRGNNREMYTSDRYFTITGNILTGCPCEIHSPLQGSLEAIYDAMIEGTINPPVKNLQATANLAYEDEEIIKIASTHIGDRFTKLIEGNHHSYQSQSHADLALCGYLARYTRSSEQIDRIFRASGLMRDKWDERRGYLTYGEKTILISLNSTFFSRSEKCTLSGGVV